MGLREDRADGAIIVEVLQRGGARQGIQINPEISAGLGRWVVPWWRRQPAPAAPSDPPGAVRTELSTVMPAAPGVAVRGGVRLFDAGPEPATYYVAPEGSNANPGRTADQPFASLAPAVARADPGDLIYLRSGTYSETETIEMNRDGTPDRPIRVRAYPGERPVLDFSEQPFSSGSRGIEISGDNGIHVTGTGNVIEQCAVHNCRDSGIQLHSGARDTLVLRCDSYRNFDDGNDGENADDGWDLWQATNAVVITRCWSWGNGMDVWGLGTAFAGDGNGFKLGGDNRPAAHQLSGCVSFGNVHHGIDQNNNTLGQTIDHCTDSCARRRTGDWSSGAPTSGIRARVPPPISGHSNHRRGDAWAHRRRASAPTAFEVPCLRET